MCGPNSPFLSFKIYFTVSHLRGLVQCSPSQGTSQISHILTWNNCSLLSDFLCEVLAFLYTVVHFFLYNFFFFFKFLFDRRKFRALCVNVYLSFFVFQIQATFQIVWKIQNVHVSSHLTVALSDSSFPLTPEWPGPQIWRNFGSRPAFKAAIVTFEIIINSPHRIIAKISAWKMVQWHPRAKPHPRCRTLPICLCPRHSFRSACKPDVSMQREDIVSREFPIVSRRFYKL